MNDDIRIKPEWRRKRRTKNVLAAELTIHYTLNQMALCGFSKEQAPNWPAGHAQVKIDGGSKRLLDNGFLVNCDACRKALARKDV